MFSNPEIATRFRHFSKKIELAKSCKNGFSESTNSLWLGNMFQLIDLQIREQICESEKVTQLFGITTSKADLAWNLHSSKFKLFHFTARKMAQSQCENSQLSSFLCWYHKIHQKRFLFNQLCQVTLSAIFTRNVNYNLCDNKKPGVAVYLST